MDTKLTASVATFRVFSTSQKPASSGLPASLPGTQPPSRKERMAATPVTEGPLILSRLASNEINYLQVNNFTRAIMPRSKIWRVSSNELVIPASFTNYWLITLNGSPQTILKLDHILKTLCKYEISCDEEEVEMTEETLADVEKVTAEIRMQSDRVRDAQQTIRKGGFPGILSGGLDTIISNDRASPTKPKPRYSPQKSVHSVYSSPESVSYAKSSESLTNRSSSAVDPDTTLELGEPDVVLATPPVTPPSQVTIGLTNKNGLTTNVSTPTSAANDTPSLETTQGSSDLRRTPETVQLLPAAASYASYSAMDADTLVNTPGTAEVSFLHISGDVAPQSTPCTPQSGYAFAISDEALVTASSLEHPHAGHPHAEQRAARIATADHDDIVLELEVEEVTPRSSIARVPSFSLSSRAPASPPSSLQQSGRPASVASAAAELLPFRSSLTKFEPRFSHPLIPSSHVSQYYPMNAATTLPSRRVALHRRELTTIGPSSLHQEVTTVGGYIGLKAVKSFFKKT